jgi:hypothetical protein
MTSTPNEYRTVEERLISDPSSGPNIWRIPIAWTMRLTAVLIMLATGGVAAPIVLLMWFVAELIWPAKPIKNPRYPGRIQVERTKV